MTIMIIIIILFIERHKIQSMQWFSCAWNEIKIYVNVKKLKINIIEIKTAFGKNDYHGFNECS